MGEPILAITKEVIDTVFKLDWGFEELIDLKKLTSEYFNLEHIYKTWRLPIHRPRNAGSLVPLG